MPGRFKGDRAGGSVSSTKRRVNASSLEAAPRSAACGILTAGSQHRFGKRGRRTCGKTGPEPEGKTNGREGGTKDETSLSLIHFLLTCVSSP